MRLSLRTKLLLYIIVATILIFAPSIGYLGLINKDDYYSIGKKDIDSVAKRYSIEIEKKIDNYFSTIRALASVNSTLSEYSNFKKQDLVLGNYKKVLNNNTKIDGIWDSWEFSRENINGKIEGKRRSYSAERIGTKIRTNIEIKDLTNAYQGIAKSPYNESVMEPYLYSFTGREKDKCLVTSLSVKFFKESKRVGIVGIDIKLSNIQNLLNSIDYGYGGSVEMLSSNARYLSSVNESLIGSSSNLSDSVYDIIKTKNIYSHIVAVNNIEYYKVYSKVVIARTNDFWILVFNVPKEQLQYKAVKNIQLTFIIGALGLLLLGVFIVFITVPLTAPIHRITKNLKIMAKGELENVKKQKTNRKDELGEMTEAMNLVGESLKEKTLFAEQIGSGKLDADINLLSSNDTLGKALISMRDNLKKAKELELDFKKEDEKRQWATKGYAFFAELLRKNNENLKELSNEIVKNLVKYVGANQAGIFIQDTDEENYLDLVAAYAYERKKYINNRVEKGIGLVGTCYIETQKIYLTDIPKDYITITSGLGDANPTSLLLVPLKNEDDVIGVLERASFNHFDDYQIEFIEKLASTIAATILTVQNNQKTQYLLEQTNQQAEEMRSQEEEMRQNMEELIATQEESERKSSQAQELTSALNKSNFVVHCNVDGVVSFVSDSYLKFLSINASVIVGRKYVDMLNISDSNLIEYNSLWHKAIEGEVSKIVSSVKINDNEHKLYQTFMPFKNEDELVEKVIILINDFNIFKEL